MMADSVLTRKIEMPQNLLVQGKTALMGWNSSSALVGFTGLE